jgi:hypothetical protein
MSPYSPITDAELARARKDPAFRQKLYSESLEALLAGLAKLRSRSSTARQSEGAKQIREGVELAVKLAELIQSPAKPARGS